MRTEGMHARSAAEVAREPGNIQERHSGVEMMGTVKLRQGCAPAHAGTGGMGSAEAEPRHSQPAAVYGYRIL